MVQCVELQRPRTLDFRIPGLENLGQGLVSLKLAFFICKKAEIIPPSQDTVRIK